MVRNQLCIAGAVLLAASASAAGPDSGERRLSPAEVEKILEAAAVRNKAAARPADPLPARPVDGEVGVTIGTGGTREVFGTAVVPVGENGSAVIMIDAGETRRKTKRRR